MRIIAGKYKNRKIDSLKDATYRPSTDKLRQALFSILSSGEFINQPAFLGVDILDLFAGSGSLSFEALSRGARSATLIDREASYLAAIKAFATKLQITSQIKLVQNDATNLPLAQQQYDLIFIDPPYNYQVIDQLLNSLIKNAYLKDQAIIVIELPKKRDILLKENYHLIKEQSYGNSKLLILRYEK